MKSFRQYLSEKLILFNNGARYGQIVIMAGGVGSGKSYIARNLLETDKFKTIDVDAWKEAFIKLKKYPAWENFSFKDPSSVSRLHLWIMKTGIRNRILDLLFDKNRNREILPNLLFDISLGSPKQLTEIVDLATEAGYHPQNIHLVYVITDWEIALNRNRARERTLPDSVVLKTLQMAGNSIMTLLHSSIHSEFNGAVKVVVANTSVPVYVTIKKEGRPLESPHEWEPILKNLIDKNLAGMPSGKDVGDQ